jgi:hypothetical protein
MRPDVRLDQAVDDAHGRGLAAARRADQHAGLAVGHLEVEPVDGGMRRAGEDLGDPARADHARPVACRTVRSASAKTISVATRQRGDREAAQTPAAGCRVVPMPR